MHPYLQTTEVNGKDAEKHPNLPDDDKKPLCALRRKEQTAFANLPHFYHTNIRSRPKTPPIMENPEGQKAPKKRKKNPSKPCGSKGFSWWTLTDLNR